MKVSIFLLLSILLSYGVLAEEKSNDQTVNSSNSASMNKTKLHIYERKLLKRMEDGRYLVQDFYDSGEKLTDPFYISNPLRLVLFNFDNKEREFVITSNHRFYAALDLYDSEALIHGKLVTWYRNGNLRSQEEYENGLPINQFNYWHPEGKKAKEIVYSNSKLGFNYNGSSTFPLSGYAIGIYPMVMTYKTWFSNGQISEEADFTNKQNAVIKKWYENGQQRQDLHFRYDQKKQSLENVAIKYWDEQGKETPIALEVLMNPYHSKRKLIKKTATGYWVQNVYENGNKASNIFFTEYNPELSDNYECFNGTIQRFDKEGNKYEEIVCREDNNSINKVKRWHNNGQLASESEVQFYAKGDDSYKRIGQRLMLKNTGIERYWYGNGQLKFEHDHETPDKLSNFIKYYPNGQIKENKKKGEYVYYGTDTRHYLMRLYNVNEFYYTDSYWRSSHKIMSYHYKDGGHIEKWGVVTVWHGNGKVSETGPFDSGRKKGHWKYFYDDGKPWMVGEYSQDKQVGVWRYWDRAGNQKEVDYNEK